MKCDRCGSDVGVVVIGGYYALCEKCHTEFKKFMAGAVLQYQEQYGYITVMYEGEDYYAN